MQFPRLGRVLVNRDRRATVGQCPHCRCVAPLRPTNLLTNARRMTVNFVPLRNDEMRYAVANVG